MLKLEAKLLDNNLSQRLLKKEQAARKAMSYTMKDLKRRAPTKVAQAVVDVYAVKQGDVKPGKGGMGGGGKVRASGETIDEFALTYTGSPMTPTHFKMTPKAPPGGSRRYTVKATIKKGSKVTIGHWAKPGSEGGAYARPGDSPYFLAGGNGGSTLPFQRKGDKLAKVFRTVSIPQMVGADEVAERAVKDIGELAEERLNHNLKRFLEAS